jgi:hypothetical protein
MQRIAGSADGPFNLGQQLAAIRGRRRADADEGQCAGGNRRVHVPRRPQSRVGLCARNQASQPRFQHWRQTEIDQIDLVLLQINRDHMVTHRCEATSHRGANRSEAGACDLHGSKRFDTCCEPLGVTVDSCQDGLTG